jgi:acyl-CoA thioesterase FadM
MPDCFHMPISVATHETGPDGFVSPQSVLRWMQEAAIRGSAAFKFDDDYYHRTESGWVLANTNIDFPGLARPRDIITAETWIADFQRIMSRRQYTFTRDDGVVIARGSSQWVHVSMKRRRPIRIPQELLDGFPIRPVYGPEDPDWGENLVSESPATTLNTAEHRVRWSDTDVYDHVNNAMYAQWFCDMLHTSDVEPHDVRRLRVNYLKDAKLGDTVRGSTWRIDDTTIAGELVNAESGDVVTRAVAEIGEPRGE